MDIANLVLQAIYSILPALLVIAVTFLLIKWINHLFAFKPEIASKYALFRGLLILAIILCGMIGVILTIPLEHSLRVSVLTVFGIIISVAITISSTTFVGNAMAGIMLKWMRQFRMGDYIFVEEHFGRISEMGILHTEIQTEQSNLTTLPNLYLVSKPVTVIRSGGTIISTEISLGYDISHKTVERVLLDAAIQTELKEPFVEIINLGNFSITYRCSGFLENTKHIITARSTFKTKILDLLHQNSIEIVSPTFMNQRSIPPERVFIPQTESHEKPAKKTKIEPESPEEIIFRKAEQASHIEEMKSRIAKIIEKNEKIQKELADITDRGINLAKQEEINRNLAEKSELEQKILEAEKASREEDT